MPTFAYEAMNSVGQAVKGELEAASSEEAISKVRSMGNFPTKIKERAAKKKGAASKIAARGASSARTRRRKVGSVSKKTLSQFTRQLSTLVDAGLPILRSLRILEQQQKPGPLRMAIRFVADDVEGGATLSEAMARHPKAFDRLYSNMVHAGEMGGVLDVILQRLADFMEKSQALKRKVVGAMIYPIAVISFAMGIVSLLMIFVVPKFEEIFSGMGEGLPGPTQMLLKTSKWFVSYGYIAIPCTIIGMVVLWKLLAATSGGRMLLDRFKLMLPVFGLIIGKTSIARFTRTLGVLLTAGVPILEALQITRETAGNEVFAKALGRVHDGIRQGESFAEPLRAAKVVDPMVTNMIDVGEETGELDKMLTKVADNYDDEVATLVSSMVSLLEPMMVIVLGLIVGSIVVALFMPMVSMIEAVQKQ